MKGFLSEFPFFSELSKRELDRLLSGLPRQQFKIGESILKQGDACRKAHLLIEGRVEITTQGKKKNLEAHIMFHRAPALFGIVEIWKDSPHLGNVIAVEPSTTVVFDRSAFLRLLNSSHQTCINVIQFLSDQIYQNGCDHRTRIFGKAEHILASYLLAQAASQGEKYQAGILLRMSINKSQIANSLAISRRQIIRAFSVLETANLIEMQGDYLVISDVEKLKLKTTEPWSKNKR